MKHFKTWILKPKNEIERKLSEHRFDYINLVPCCNIINCISSDRFETQSDCLKYAHELTLDITTTAEAEENDFPGTIKIIYSSRMNFEAISCN